jgi:GMC oxidoreductase
VCDTVVPSLTRDPDPDGFFARKASDLWVPQVIEYLVAGMPEDRRAGVLALLGALGEQGFVGCSLGSPEQITLTLFLFYGLPDERGQNPNWKTLGYPGPIGPAPDVERPLLPYTPDGDTTLDTDVCIVGSGAGGGVMAGVLSERGLKVVVLEAGGYFDQADFNQLEIPAYQNLYWRRGPSLTAEMNVSLQAGFCLGGGTVVNWTNSLQTTPWVREQWEREFGLEGLAGADFDRHLDAVWERVSVNDRCSELNSSQQRMKTGAGKLSTVKTYLQDAYDRGAVLVTRCWAERILVQRGHARGVEATWSDPRSGRSANVTVRARQVVVACDALESPAPLLRSGIGSRPWGTICACTSAPRPLGSMVMICRRGRVRPKPASCTSSKASRRDTGSCSRARSTRPPWPPRRSPTPTVQATSG